MQFLDLTLPTPEENLACDDALFQQCERDGGPEVLRTWGPVSPFVVVGYGTRVLTEVNVENCATLGVPVLRRISGGGTIVQAPGCWNYSVIVRMDRGGELGSVTGTTSYVLERVAGAVSALAGRRLERRGASDLAVGDRKVAGSAQRRGIRCALVHGCLLLNLDIDLVERLLPLPPRQPDYRRARSHTEFLMNLGLSPVDVSEAVAAAWQAVRTPAPYVPRDIPRLVRARYSRRNWTFLR